MSQNEIVRYALNNRWLEEQGFPDMNAPAAVAAREMMRSLIAWTEERSQSRLDRSSLRAESPRLIGTALKGAVCRVVWDPGVTDKSFGKTTKRYSVIVFCMTKIDGRKLDHGTSEHIRILAVPRVREDGESPSDVMDSLGLCRTTIYPWLRKHDKGGLDALKASIPVIMRNSSNPMCREHEGCWNFTSFHHTRRT